VGNVLGLDGVRWAVEASRGLPLRVIDAVGSGAGSGMRLRPPVFDKEWPAFSRAVRDWRGPALQRTIARLYEAEKSCKQAGAPSEAIIRNLILRIATRTI
jgi:DNA polymerase-3 subunit delta